MTELICWPLDNKQYTSVALGAAYAARSRGVLNADSFAAKTNGNNTVTVGKGVGCIHVSDQWAAFPFSQGDVTLTNETVKCNFDRGRRFTVDTMDDLETAGLAFGRLSAEFIRTKVVPELDAFRFAAYCGKTGVTKVEGALADGSAVLQALRAASTALDEAEVPLTERYLFITPSLHGMVQDLDTTKSREILTGFAKIVQVPQKRFHTAIDQLSGGTGEEAGGYKKADGASDLNFVIVHKPAVIQYHKHAAPKIVTPDANQDGDAYKYGYRLVSIADLYANKLAGVYASYKPVAGG